LAQQIAFATDIPEKFYPFYRLLFNSICRCQTSLFFAPENTLRPIMIFIARTSGVTEASGTSISPFFSLGTFLLFPSIKGLQNPPSSLTSLVRSSFRSLANVLCCCNQMIDCAFYTVGTAIPLNAVNDYW